MLLKLRYIQEFIWEGRLAKRFSRWILLQDTYCRIRLWSCKWGCATESADFGFIPLLWRPQGPLGCLEKQNHSLSLNLVVWCANIQNNFNNANKEFLTKSSLQKIPPKKFLPKESSKKIQKISKWFLKKFLRFWKYPIPYIALRGRKPFRACLGQSLHWRQG